MLNFDELRNKKNSIQNCIENMNIKEAKMQLEEYKYKYIWDLDIYMMEAIIYFYEKKYEISKEILEKKYYKYEYNIELNFNLGNICFYNNDLKKALYYLMKAKILDKEKKITANINEIIEQIYINIKKEEILKCIDELKQYFENYQIKFPLINQYGNYINQCYNEKFYCGIYDYYYEERDGIEIKESEVNNLLKSEIIPCDEVNNYKLNIEEKTILPLMLTEKNQKIKISVNQYTEEIDSLLSKRFYYYTFNKNQKISITSENKFIIGNKILCKKDINKPSLVLNIFLDGLSQKFIEDMGLKNVIPNIYNFFKEGTICDNVYVTGEWTYVNLASFFTGKYITNHRVFNPIYNTNNIYNQKLYSEMFHDAGYYCAKIDGDWRSNPGMGYMKGLNRYLYQPSVRGMHINDIIIETIEHIEAFKDLNKYMWICIPDLHDIADEFETRLSTQVNTSIKSRFFKKTNESSVRKINDKSKIERYMIQLKRVDTYLGLLFNYIKENFNEDDFLISLFSDHGQGYLIKDNEFLEEERTKVPMMFRGKNIIKGRCDDLISGLDLNSIILNSLDMEDSIKSDMIVPKYFGGKGREYVYTESIFPGSPYYASINDKKHKFFFTSIEKCENDGRVKLEHFNVKLINKKNNREESKLYPEKVKKYIKEVFIHMREYIII